MTEQYVAHKFDPQVAAVYGIVPAILFQYICWRSKNSPTRWIQFTLNELCKQYSYLGQKQVRNALDRLICSQGKTPALVLRKGMRGKSFLYAPVCHEPAVERWVKFDTKIAKSKKLGLVEAIIFYNIGYWIKRNWDDHAREYCQYLDPTKFDYDADRLTEFAYQKTRQSAAHFCYIDAWVKDHPYVSLRSAFYGFSRLLKAKMLVRTYLRNRLPLWQFTDKMAKLHVAKSLMVNAQEDSSARRANAVQEGQIQCKEDKCNAGRAEELGISSSSPEGNQNVRSSTLEACVVRFAHSKQVEEDSDPFRQVLAGARPAAGTASNRPSAKLSLERKIRRDLNRPNLPVYKAHGSPVKRSYHRQPVPQNEFDLNVMDDMTPEQRAAYVRQ